MRGRNKMVKLLQSEDYSIRGARNALAVFFRMALKDLEMTPMWWETLVESYLTDVMDIPLKASNRSTEKGNINSQSANDKLTWSVFCKALSVVKVESCEMTLVFKRRGEYYVHSFKDFIEHPEPRYYLSRLFKELIVLFKVGPIAWDVLMEAFLRDPQLGLPEKGGERSTIKGNLESRIREDVMSWKVFMRALKFLGVTDELQISLSITVDGETYTNKIDLHDFPSDECFESRYQRAREVVAKKFGLDLIDVG